jgi:hypothetical protein
VPESITVCVPPVGIDLRVPSPGNSGVSPASKNNIKMGFVIYRCPYYSTLSFFSFYTTPKRAIPYCKNPASAY